ncbi:MAG TPA: phage holin family protein [Symbiobacteriaceae bacterium]|nr:phage holin family protein [Symbiobacteriaceae bacterium]
MDKLFKTLVTMGGAVASYLYGGWSALLGVLLVFVIADYTTGVVAAGIEGKLSSSVGFRGIARKIGIFLVVAVAHLADTALGQNHMIRDASIFFYLGNELLSIIENAGRIGVPVPPLITQAVEILRGKAGKGEVSDGADTRLGP